MSIQNNLRKTHPMVLIAAVALTIFSLLGSAAITGLIPTAHSEKDSTPVAESRTEPATPNHATGIDRFNTPAAPQAQPERYAAVTPAQPTTCSNCGRIVSIQAVEQQGEASGLGAVAGGVAGGVIGNQIGKGRGNTLMTVLGVGGGAYAGHTIEKNMKTTTAYVIKVEMQDGTLRKITQYSAPEFSVGDRVRLKSGQLLNA